MGNLDSWVGFSAEHSPFLLLPPGHWKSIRDLQPQATPVMLYCQHEEFISGRLQVLEAKLDSIISRLDHIESIIGADEVIELRDIPREQAKREIRQYFNDHHGEDLYASDVGDALSLDVFLADDLMTELVEDGEIKAV